MDEAERAEDVSTEPARAAGLRDLIERALYFGLGAAAVAKDRLESVVDEFVAQGELSAEDGRAMLERMAQKSREEARSAVGRLDTSLRGTYQELGIGTKRDLEDLTFRLRLMEHRLEVLERQVDSLRNTST